MMLKVSHKCKLLRLQFTMHLKQLFFIIKVNNMHINLLCSLNQYCSLKNMTSGQLCLNIDSIVICIRYQMKYMIHQYHPCSFQRVFDFVSSYEMRQRKTETSQNVHMKWMILVQKSRVTMERSCPGPLFPKE